MEKQSEKDIAKRMDVSVSVIDRILNEISSNTVLRHPTLPKSMKILKVKWLLLLLIMIIIAYLI